MSTGLVSFNTSKMFSFASFPRLAVRIGRVGNPGKAISFVVGDYDVELLTKLIPLCLNANVPIADWMNEVAESGGGDDGEDDEW